MENALSKIYADCDICGNIDLLHMHVFDFYSKESVFLCDNCFTLSFNKRGAVCSCCKHNRKLLIHHILYNPEVTTFVCFSCHYKIHHIWKVSRWVY